MVTKYTSHDLLVKYADKKLRNIPKGKPECIKANGRPTTPPPMMVDIRLSAASITVI